MKRSKWYWIALLGFFVTGTIITLLGVYQMYDFEILDSHETLRDAMKDARRATRGTWLPGLVLMVVSYIITFFPKKG